MSLKDPFPPKINILNFKNMNSKFLYAVIGVLVLIIAVFGVFLIMNNEAGQKDAGTVQQAGGEMFDCGLADDPGCFMNRMGACSPVTVRMMSNDGKTAIRLSILGVENERCHFQRKLDEVLNLDCQFPKGTLNWDTIDQTFGNDRGLQSVVDSACKAAGATW